MNLFTTFYSLPICLLKEEMTKRDSYRDGVEKTEATVPSRRRIVTLQRRVWTLYLIGCTEDSCHHSIPLSRTGERVMCSPSFVRIRMPAVISPSATGAWHTLRMLMAAGLPCLPGWQRNGSTATRATVGGVAWHAMAEGGWTRRVTHHSSRRLYKNVRSTGTQLPTTERASLRIPADQCSHFLSSRFEPFKQRAS